LASGDVVAVGVGVGLGVLGVIDGAEGRRGWGRRDGNGVAVALHHPGEQRDGEDDQGHAHRTQWARSHQRWLP
jgi:hypothetical protein